MCVQKRFQFVFGCVAKSLVFWGHFFRLFLALLLHLQVLEFSVGTGRYLGNISRPIVSDVALIPELFQPFLRSPGLFTLELQQ